MKAVLLGLVCVVGSALGAFPSGLSGPLTAIADEMKKWVHPHDNVAAVNALVEDAKQSIHASFLGAPVAVPNTNQVRNRYAGRSISISIVEVYRLVDSSHPPPTHAQTLRYGAAPSVGCYDQRAHGEKCRLERSVS